MEKSEFYFGSWTVVGEKTNREKWKKTHTKAQILTNDGGNFLSSSLSKFSWCFSLFEGQYCKHLSGEFWRNSSSLKNMEYLQKSKVNNHCVISLPFITKIAVTSLNQFPYLCYCGSYEKRWSLQAQYSGVYHPPVQFAHGNFRYAEEGRFRQIFFLSPRQFLLSGSMQSHFMSGEW